MLNHFLLDWPASKKIFVSIILGLLVTGCTSSYVTVLKDPESEDIQTCKAGGFGILGTIMAQDMHDKCVEQFELLGYEPVQKS